MTENSNTDGKLICDHLPLINMIEASITEAFRTYAFDNGKEALRLGFVPKNAKKKTAFIVTESDTALEIGSPSHVSSSAVLWTNEKEIRTDSIHILGPELHEMGKGPAAIAVTVITNPGAGIDPMAPDFNSAKNLSNKIPGFMTRSIPGKLWIRISHGLMKKSFTLVSLGQCLIFAYRDAFPDINGVKVVIVSQLPDMIRSMESIHKRAAAVQGENTRLRLEADGTLSCPDLDCPACEDKPVCDVIREAIRKKKRA